MDDTPQVAPVPETDGSEYLSCEARVQRWQSKRPPIAHLKDGLALLEGNAALPLFDIGTRIVVDIRTRFLRGEPWLETIVGLVRSIDDDTGIVTLFDESGDPRSRTVRYANFKDELQLFKLAPLKGDPFEPPPPDKKVAAPRDPNKKGRGRPKGSKNRPKDVIQAEREAKRSARSSQ